jgi:hypothetical protein
LAYFTDGTIPDAVWQVPPTWSTQQIAEFQAYWDTIVNDAVTRRKMRFAPGGVTPVMTRPPEALVDQFDEWLARIIAFAFSLPPTPFVRLVNRATGETMYEEALQEGLMPLMQFIKGIIDYIIVHWFGFDDIEMVWDDVRKIDPAEKEQRDVVLANEGAISLDDIRSERGMEPLGVPAFIKGIGPMGFMSIEGVKKVIANGWDVTGLPQPQPGMEAAGVAGAAPDGQNVDQLVEGLPPEILEALGIDPAELGNGAPGAQDQPAAPGGTDFGGGTQTGPSPDSAGDQVAPGGGNVVPFHQHPGVRAALADGERQARHHAARMKGGQR